jgi:2-oxoisovalerate ferredoxin oxidoreductase alpha subunit
MTHKQLVKGNDAIIRSAVLAGCRAFYGYPITPASEITEGASRFLPAAGGTFLQAESETAAINMLYGASATGLRCMTASSGPGLSLMQEGLSYLAGAELPCVIADITRGGPGLGNLNPEQGDYHQIVKGGGHGCYKNIVLAPDSCQEMADLTALAFELADRYRNPAVVLADGYIGQMMEPVAFADVFTEGPRKDWAVLGTAETRQNCVTSIHLEADTLERHVRHLEQKYQAMERDEVRFEAVQTEDADIVLIGYGIVARILKQVVEMGRREGIRLGLLRPITLFPFPTVAIRDLTRRVEEFAVVELSTGQMLEDVRLAVEGRKPVQFYSRVGGNVPSAGEILEFVRAHCCKEALYA